ncbi:putative inactive neutral ceramidase B isoform X1 [Stegodyphus dumicola]|uniref:putative inactive neutral ceramidase B isoform X1 n=1 Tax=Stegodyphus dumicola TaxID=202533 RepID=UPI0015ADCA19|nr:putative inactive neutral ceramidase B isoform X1 [Stegodyphus dumicola]
MLGEEISLQPGVIFDTAYFGKNFGDVLKDAKERYCPGDTVFVTFVSGHPRNDPMLERTFLTIEKMNPLTGNWTVIATDADWETKFHWVRTNILLGHSEAIMSWDIPEDTEPGKYRIRHFGHSKSIFQKITPYKGTSSPFIIKKYDNKIF